jgi:restriction endonuclease S subunit
MQSGLGRLHFGPLSQSTTMQMNVTVKELRTLPVPIFTQEEQAALVDTLEQSDIAYQTATAAAGQRREIALQVVTDVLIGKTKIKHG